MSTTPTNPQSSGMFSEPVRERTFPTTAVAIASVALVILAGVLLLLGRRKAL